MGAVLAELHLETHRSDDRLTVPPLRETSSTNVNKTFDVVSQRRFVLRLTNPFVMHAGAVPNLLYVSNSTRAAGQRPVPPADAHLAVESSGDAAVAVLSPPGFASALRFGCANRPYSGGVLVQHGRNGPGEAEPLARWCKAPNDIRVAVAYHQLLHFTPDLASTGYNTPYLRDLQEGVANLLLDVDG